MRRKASKFVVVYVGKALNRCLYLWVVRK